MGLNAKENGEPSKKRTRSRFGCRNCKRLKVKCDERKPSCSLCLKSNKPCDYSIQLTWGGRPFKKKKPNNYGFATINTFQQVYNNGEKQLPKSVNTKLTELQSNIQNDTPEVLNASSSDIPYVSPKLQPSSDLSSLDDPYSPVFPVQIDLVSTPSSSITNQLVTLETLNSQKIIDTHPSEAEVQLQSSFGFRDLETTNLAAKEFLNNCILPELENFGTKYDEYVTGLSPRIKELEESLDDLLDEESLVTTNVFSNISSAGGSGQSFIQVNSKSTDQENETSLTGFEFVPFSVVPLPDMLLKVPFFRENYHAYVEVYSRMIVPAPPSTYKDNPLTCILPRMSLSSRTDGMLSLLIAQSVVQGSHYRGQRYPKELVNMLLKKALKDLYNRLSDPTESESDYTLALIMLLGCFEILSGERYDWRSHYYGARKIILSRGLVKAKQNSVKIKTVGFDIGDESDITYFFARWFAYTDVIGSLSSSSLVKKPLSGNETHLIWEAPEISEETKLNLKDIDPFMGFDLRLLKYFAEIVTIVKERERNFDRTGLLSADLIRMSLEIKESMSSHLAKTELERDVIVNQIKAEGDEKKLKTLERYDTLRATNRCFALAGILQIYRRILLMSTASKLVQDLITEITSVLKCGIPVGTPAACCTIFSLFTAGCEAIGPETRSFYGERLLSLGKAGFSYGYIAHDLMLECWETGKYWADIITEKNIDLTFV